MKVNKKIVIFNSTNKANNLLRETKFRRNDIKVNKIYEKKPKVNRTRNSESESTWEVFGGRDEFHHILEQICTTEGKKSWPFFTYKAWKYCMGAVNWYCLCPKHRKNCKCCPGHYLIINHYSSLSWFKFRNLSVIVTNSRNRSQSRSKSKLLFL